MNRTLLPCILALILLGGCHPDAGAPHLEDGTVMRLTSPAFSDGEVIPKKYAGEGDDKSPPLKWDEAPNGVKSYALICDDPDAPAKTWVHWVIWNIPAEARELTEGQPTDAHLAGGARQGKNDFGAVGYGGPAPPPGKAHHYFFKLYALDTTLELPEASAMKQQLELAMIGHVLGHGQLVGTYQK